MKIGDSIDRALIQKTISWQDSHMRLVAQRQCGTPLGTVAIAVATIAIAGTDATVAVAVAIAVSVA